MRFALFNLVRSVDNRLTPQLELPCDDFPQSAKPIPAGGFYKDEDGVAHTVDMSGDQMAAQTIGKA